MTPSFTPEKDAEEDEMAPRSNLSRHDTETPAIRRMPPAFLQTPSLMTPSYNKEAPLTAATQPMTPMTASASPEEQLTTSSRVSSQPGTAPTTAPFPRGVYEEEDVRVDYRPAMQFGASRLFQDDSTTPLPCRPAPQDRPQRASSPPPPFPSQRELSHRPVVSESTLPEPYPFRRSTTESEPAPHVRTSSFGSRHGSRQQGSLRESGHQVEDPWTMSDNFARRRSSSASMHRQRSFRTPSTGYIGRSKQLLDATPDTSSSSESSPDVSPSPNRSESKRKRRRPKSPPAPDTERSLVGWLSRSKRMRTNRLVLVLCAVGMMSLFITVFTSRAVIPNEIVEGQEVFRPDRPVKPGIRRPGSMTPGKKKTKDVPHKERITKEDHKDSSHKDDHKKKDDHHDDDHKHHKTDKHSDHKDKHHKRDAEEHDYKHHRHDEKYHKRGEKSAKAVAALQKQELHLSGTKAPPLGDQTSAVFGLDSKMYKNVEKSQVFPRIFVLHESAAPLPDRQMEAVTSPVLDNTQLYGVLDSEDERLAKMEMRDPYVEGECVPMQEWQTTFHPSCNGMHELPLEHMGESNGDEVKLFGTKGYWRNAWKLDFQAEHDSVVLKTLKFQHNFEDAHFEHDRIDAVAMERLTASPHVINVFGYCGHSVLTEYADGKRLGELADKSKKTPLARLKIARDIAEGLADVHGIDGDGNTTFVHLDVNPANVVSIGGRLKLNDFNIGIILRWNTTSNQHCGFPAQYPNPQWRSPEEARGEQNLSEKVDVFSMGHIFFRLICGHEPWNKLEPGGKPSKEEVNAKVQKGLLPFIPEHVLNSTDPEMIAVRDVMLKCYTTDPTERPSARDVANMLDEALVHLTSESGS